MKLSEHLVLDARLTGEVAERSIAGQIEFWASLGRAVESVLRTDRALALKKRGDVAPLSACLRAVNSRAGRARLSNPRSVASIVLSPSGRFGPRSIACIALGSP